MNFKQSLLSGKLAEKVNEAVFGEEVMNITTVRNIMLPLISQHDGIECFYVLYLNSKNKVIQIKQEFKGSITSCAVYPREVLKEALHCNASNLILVHNHPSGNTKPSPGDINITERIAMGSSIMGISLHDHVIIGNDTFSMASAGIIDDINREIKKLEEKWIGKVTF